MKIASWNVNGIRAIEKRGDLQSFLDTYSPDIFFLQEVKATPVQLSEALRSHADYHQFYHPADKPGYAGTGVWIRRNGFGDVNFLQGMTGFNDTEGRISRIDFQDWSLFGVYFPNGGKSDEAWQGKIVFYEQFLTHVNAVRSSGRKVIWCGDVNCAHEEIDLARPKENQNAIGFLPEERAWVSKVIKEGWIDVFRQRNPHKVVYSWWHVLSGARKRNVGWRIDYFFADKALVPAVQNIEYLNAQLGSDHCPVLLEITN